MLMGSISIFVTLKVLNHEDPNSNLSRVSVGPSTSATLRAATLRNQHYNNPTKWILLLNFAKIMSLVALLAIATIQPSVLSFIYFVIFWGAVFMWGFSLELSR